MNADFTPFDDLEVLLRKYDCTWHANLVAECRNRLIRNDVSAWQTIATVEWWGGAGSIADVFLHTTFLPTTEEEEKDNREFRAALIKVYDLMKANGIAMEAARSWTDIFRKWQEMGI